jgi:Flp pilus assembly protein TadG
MRHAPPRASARPRPLRRGLAATEFALILPLLVTLVLGTLDFGRFAYYYIAVTNAARAGAAFGCMNPQTPATWLRWRAKVVQAAADEMTGQTGYAPEQLTVGVITTDESNGLWRVQVTASYPFQTLVSWPGIPSNVTLRQAVVLRAIR